MSQKERKIVDYGGYRVENDGSIRNIKTGRLLISKEIVRMGGKNVRRANLVARLFLGAPRNSRSKVMFKDGDKHNCNVDNLYYYLPWPLYRDEVLKLTSELPLHQLEGFDGVVGGGMVLNYIVPIRYGFANGVPSDEIACLGNLQVLEGGDNVYPKVLEFINKNR